MGVDYTFFLAWMWQFSQMKHLTCVMTNIYWVWQTLGINVWTKAVPTPVLKVLHISYYYDRCLLPSTKCSSWLHCFFCWSQSFKFKTLEFVSYPFTAFLQLALPFLLHSLYSGSNSQCFHLAGIWWASAARLISIKSNSNHIALQLKNHRQFPIALGMKYHFLILSCKAQPHPPTPFCKLSKVSHQHFLGAQYVFGECIDELTNRFL